MVANKFDLQKIISDVKSMIGTTPIPEANKDDPVGYCLSELSKLTKDLAENHAKQADTIAKISSMLGALHKEIAGSAKPAEVATAAKPQAQEATTEATKTK